MRTTQTKNPSFKTSSRRRRLTSSARNRRISSLTWTNTEIFELCETSSQQQCPECNLHWEAGIVYCTCGRCLRISRSEKEVDKSNNDVVSIPAYVIKKKNKRGAKHGPSERQRMYYNFKNMLHKAGQKKHGGHSSILARWHSDHKYRDSLTRIGWTEQDIMLFDRIALEIIHTSQKKLREFETQNIGFWNWIRMVLSSRWINDPRLCSSKKRMQEITRRRKGKGPAGIQNHSSKLTSKTRKRTNVRRNWRTRLCGRSSNGLEVLLTGAGKPVAFVVIVLVHKLGKQPMDDKKLEFLAFFTVWPLVNMFFSELGPVSVGREINTPTTDGVCRQISLSHDSFVHVQRITERIAPVQSLITRTRAAQVVCLGVLKK